jgi:hypothetical protein
MAARYKVRTVLRLFLASQMMCQLLKLHNVELVWQGYYER